jgi:glycosyltransferase involved in cell wall biosynthesis
MKPRIDIVVLTYNHEAYIQKCLEGIANQIYDGHIRVILINDASTDDTQTILNQITADFPFELVIYKNETNEGILHNIKLAAEKLAASYVAFIDGDDYWTENYKLQRQIDFLEKNKEFIGCFHDVQILHADDLDSDLFQNSHSYNHIYQFPQAYCLTEVVYRKIIPTSSVVLRFEGLNKVKWRYINDQYSSFWKLLCFIVNGSKLKFINEVWSVYRNHDKGISKAVKSENFHQSHLIFLRRILFLEEFKLFRYELLTQLLKEAELTLRRTNSISRKTVISLQYMYFTAWRLWFLNNRR